jgi:hypothetical protein
MIPHKARRVYPRMGDGRWVTGCDGANSVPTSSGCLHIVIPGSPLRVAPE